MPRWTPAAIVGGAYKDDARSFSVQDTVNWIPERAEADGTRSDGMLRDAPGAHVVCDLGTNAPIRGLHNCEGRLLAVSGPTLFEVAADYTATSRGSIPGRLAGVDRAQPDHRRQRGADRQRAGRLRLQHRGRNPGADHRRFLPRRHLRGLPRASAGADRAAAPLLVPFGFDAGHAVHQHRPVRGRIGARPAGGADRLARTRCWCWATRTGEFYTPTGGNTSFFERMEGTTMEVGCASPHAVVRLDSTVFWIGSDGKGYRLNGYNAQRITTHAIEQAWSRCDLKKAFAFTFEDQGHTIAYFTFPDGGTWGYDVATQEWHRRTSKGLDRWRINALVYWNGHWIGGDYSNGKLYRLDWDHKLECCEPLERRRISGVLHDNQNEVGVNAGWMTTNHPLESGSVWESTDLSGAWGDPVARDPNVATPDFGPVSLGLDRVLIAGTDRRWK
jgi:hypothetical protein